MIGPATRFGRWVLVKMKKIKIYPFSHYESIIHSDFIIDHCGIDLSKLGQKNFELNLPITLSDSISVDLSQYELKEIKDFVAKAYHNEFIKPIWYKINVIDQAVNEYVGIGFLNIEDNWMEFVINYLIYDRAEQSGDTIFILFDIEMNWAVNITLSQDDQILRIERFENKTSTQHHASSSPV